MGANGKALTICSSELAASFNEIATALSEAGYIFNLQKIPLENTIEVFINGIQLLNSSNRYSYDPSRNAVVFRAGLQPAPNESIRIQYSHL